MNFKNIINKIVKEEITKIMQEAGNSQASFLSKSNPLEDTNEARRIVVKDLFQAEINKISNEKDVDLEEAAEIFIETKLPKIDESKDPIEIAKKYNDLISDSTYSSVLKKIFSYELKGLGKGEILLALLFSNVSVNGGHSTYDLDIAGKKVEVKNAIVGKKLDGVYAFNFKFGREVSRAKFRFINRLKSLFELALANNYEYKKGKFISDFDDEDRWASGELTGLWNTLKNVDINIFQKDLVKILVSIDKDGNVFLPKNEESIANIYKNIDDLRDIINTLRNKNKILPAPEIESLWVNDVLDLLNVDYFYVFGGGPKTEDRYKYKLLVFDKDAIRKGMKVDAITQHRVKPKINVEYSIT